MTAICTRFRLNGRVAGDSPVISIFGNGFRLYYVGTDRQVHRLFTLAGTFADEVMPGTKVAAASELAWIDDQWVNSPLQHSAARDSALTCHGSTGSGPGCTTWTRDTA